LWWKRIRSWYATENWKQSVTSAFFTIASIWMYVYINEIEVALDNILQLFSLCWQGYCGLAL
jgi:hypothetical protein